MSVKGCPWCIKCLLVLLNVILLIIGAVILAFSLWLLFGDDQRIDHYVIYMLIIVGAVMTGTCLIGCIAACCESTVLLIIYSVLMVAIVVICNIGTGRALLVHLTGKDFDEILEASFSEVISNYGRDSDVDMVLDALQRENKCCGQNGPLDYTKSYMNRKGNVISSLVNTFKVPQSCCVDPGSRVCDSARQVSIGGVIGGQIYSEGCSAKFVSQLKKHRGIVDGVGFGLIALELLLLVLAISLTVSLCTSKRRHYRADEASAPMMGHSKV